MKRTATTPDGTHSAEVANDKYSFASCVRWEHDARDGSHKAGDQRIIGFHATEQAARRNPNVKYFQKRGSVIVAGVVAIIEGQEG